MSFRYRSAINHKSDPLPPAVTPHPAVQTSPHSSTSAIVQWLDEENNSFLTLAAELFALCSMRLDHAVHYLISPNYMLLMV